MSGVRVPHRPPFLPAAKMVNEAWKGFASCTEGALHGTQCRFIRRQACFIKTPFQMKQLHFISLWSIVPLHFTIWSTPLTLRMMKKWKNESFSPFAIFVSLNYIIPWKGNSVMEKSSNKLVDLSVAFAVEILNLVKYLKGQRETIICYANILIFESYFKSPLFFGSLNTRFIYTKKSQQFF